MKTVNMLRQLLVVSRPISWPNTAYPFAAGYLVVQHTVDIRFILGSLFFLVPYNLVMYGVNDVFDYESDIRNPRKGGIEGALSAKRLHRPILIAATVSSVPFMLAMVWLGTWQSTVVLAVLMFFVLAYSVPVLRFKERAFVDSMTSSIHFVGPLVYALSFAGVPSASYALLAAFFLWGMASHAFGAVQDVLPDREAGIGSVATVLGAANTVRLSVALYLGAALLLLTYGIPTALVGLIAVAYICNIWPFRSVSDENAGSANTAWRRFIYLNLLAGFAVTMLLLYLYAVGS